MPSTVIVVPCFNEGARLDIEEYRRFIAHNSWIDFRFVDDGSSDGTWEVLRRLAAGSPARITVRRLRRNRGKSEAVRLGVLDALDGACGPDCEFVGYWDADLATPLDQVAAFRDVLKDNTELDLVMGSRVKLLGHAVQRRVIRHYAGRIAAAAASVLLDLGAYDTQCGAKLFRVRRSTRELFDQPFLTRWMFDVEILARWIRQHQDTSRSALEARIHEVPLPQWNDVPGSTVRAIDMIRAPMQLARIYLAYRRDL